MCYTPKYVLDEITFPGVIEKGARGIKARRVQEWVCLHGHFTSTDADFGNATMKAVTAFQTAKGLPANGVVDQATWNALVLPMVNAVSAGATAGTSLDHATLEIAHAHLRQRPFEVGGNNRGPWVRIYTSGNEGNEWKWCAGFVTFVLHQACDTIGTGMPIAGSTDCDELASQAKKASLFIRGTEIEDGTKPWSILASCGIFLKRKTASDWTHTGFTFNGSGDSFDTIEGNTSQAGGSDDNQAYTGHRAFGSYDFIKIA